MSEAIGIQKLALANFKPKENLAEFEIYYTKNNKPDSIKKEYELKNPMKLTHQIILDIKSKNKIIFEDDPLLDPLEKLERYSPIILNNHEFVEEKLYNFLNDLCEKSKKLKNCKDAIRHMKIFNQFKTAALVFENKKI